MAALLEPKLERIANWLVGSGLKVNEAKTDLCLFYKNDAAPINITFNGSLLKTQKEINILGVIFNSKLNWSKQIGNTILKSKRALNAIKLVKGYFSNKELLQILTSNFFSVLYYNSEIWHLPSLNVNLKQFLSHNPHSVTFGDSG